MVQMDGHCFVSALFYALIGIDAFMSKPMLLYALSLSSSTTSLTSSLLDPLSPVTSIVDEQQHTEKSTNNGNKNKSSNIIGRNAYSNSILMSKPKSMCKLSEWKCSNGNCIPLSKFCNGIADCNDKSDEPNECSVCNRTWFGDIGKTYEMEIDKPSTLPFLCHLNFTAPGGLHGDIIQINIDKFNIGRFTSHTNDGCPDGYMTISEPNFSSMDATAGVFNDNGNRGRNQNVGGKWCGIARGVSYYYSESSSINITLKLFKFVQQPQHSLTLNNNNFSFRIIYKFLKRTDAKLRNEKGIWTGEPVPGTYCDKNIYDCDRRLAI